MINLPDPIDPASDESAATAYAARLSVACAPILKTAPGCDLLEPIDQARVWQIYLGNVELDDETRADLAQRFGQKIRDDAAARQALALWRSVEAWHAAHIRRDPRYALRCLMSDLSEEATCASWHYDTEFALWELLTGARTSWMRLGKSDSRIIDLRRLHEKTGGWYCFDEAADGGWGQKIFVDTQTWLSIYWAAIDDPDRAHFAVIDGTPRRGRAATQAALSPPAQSNRAASATQEEIVP